MKINITIACILIAFASSISAQPFDKTQFVKNPMIQFKNWLEAAKKENVYLPEDAILSTSSKEGRPFSRGITIRDMDEEGIVFYTNPSSGKWKQMQENPQAVLNFVYDNHQVILKGVVELSSICENHPASEKGAFAWCPVRLIPFEAEFDQVEWFSGEYRVLHSMVYAKKGKDWELSKEPKQYILPVVQDPLEKKT